MEVKVVKSFATDLQTACREAERLGKCQLDLDFFRETNVSTRDILSFISIADLAQVKTRLVAFLAAVPTEIRSAVKSSGRPARKGKTLSESKISLSPEIRPSFDAWKQDKVSFYTQANVTFESYHCPLSAAYIFVSQLEKRYAADRVRRRLVYVMFSFIKEQSGRTRLRDTTLEGFAQIILRSGLVDTPPETIKGQLGTWASRGDKYRLLANDLGGLGSLFLLPEDFGDS